MSLFDFRITPKPGHVVMVQSQRYVLIDTHLHQRPGGIYAMVLAWQSHCPVRGATFTVTRDVNRRCDLHKAPGLPVKLDRRVCQNRRGGRHG